MAVAIGVLVVIAFFVLIFLGASVRVLREYERGVVFRLGRLIAQKGPGLILLIPLIDRMVRVDLRTVTLNIPPQEVITRDNVPVRVNAVAYFRVIDANNAIVEVENFLLATSQISQTTLRSVLGKADLDQLLSERERLNDAADIISQNPATLQLRYLQTLLEIGSNQNTTVVFPLPIEFMDAFRELRKRASGG
jgi:regulator of protease activity HflC (stomatin/prohibitin superfamily)